jgi:hypothetical protein
MYFSSAFLADAAWAARFFACRFGALVALRGALFRVDFIFVFAIVNFLMWLDRVSLLCRP